MLKNMNENTSKKMENINNRIRWACPTFVRQERAGYGY